MFIKPLEEASYALGYLVLVLPVFSVFLGPFFVIFTKRESGLERNKYRNRLIFWLTVATVSYLFGRWLQRALKRYNPDIFDYLNAGFYGLGIFVLLIPILSFSMAIQIAGKRLQGMGYNKFICLAGHIPGIGVPFLIYLGLSKNLLK